MKKRILNKISMTWFVSCLLPFCSLANDGVFYAHGNTLFPVKETVVSMDKEILGLTRDGDYVNVSVYFEFFNPGPEKEVTVGFVTPRAGGDFPEEQSNHPQISGFTVEMNGRELPYKIFVVDSSGFGLPDSVAYGTDFIYHFKALFLKGKNIIRHSYRFRASSSVETEYDVPYVITTGKMWAKGSIGDFTLQIDMGRDSYFSVPNSFVKNGTAANWKIEGKGKLSASPIWFMQHLWRTAAISDGILSLNEKNFEPDTNISVVQWPLHNEVYLWRDDKKEHRFHQLIWNYIYQEGSHNEMDKLSDEDLRLLRNYPYARKGYVFQSQDLNTYFSQFNWYLPKPNLKMDEISLTAEDQTTIKMVKAEEERRKVADPGK